jgi:hypothetical protein
MNNFKNEEDFDSPMFEAIAADGSKIQFTGELVAEVSAQLPEKERWTEFQLYLTSFNTWVLQGIGRSRIKGEKDRYWYVVSSDPADWLDKILGEDVSRLAKKLLRDSFQYLRTCDDIDE